MDFSLSDEQRMLVETVRAFVAKELAPHETEVEKTNQVTPALIAEIHAKAKAAGLYAANMPEDLGGGGLDAVSLALMERELGRTSFALQYAVARPSNILRACKGEQIERYLLPAIRGERVECLALTEPGAGSDLRSMKTRAVRDGDHFVINGTKHFISYADVADFAILFAASGEEETKHRTRKKITSFLVDKGIPGFEVRMGPHSVSHRGFHHCELIFTDCRIHERQILGEEHRGFDVANEWLGATRLTVAVQCVGRAQRALELAIEWAATRKQFGQTIGRFQGVSFKLADMATEIAAAELLVMQAAWKLDRGSAADQDFAMAKLYATEMLARVTDSAVQTFGGMGLMEEMPLERLWRDARVERIWDGTSEIQRHIISRSLLRPHES
jgi:acyl-CoA dehydrogenase